MSRVELRDPWWAALFSWWLAVELHLLQSFGATVGDREVRLAAHHYERIVAPHRRLRFSR